MSPEARAILFDLDDTLYPLQCFVLSGFADVARHLARTDGLDASTVFRVLRRSRTGRCRGRELQACVEHFGLAPARVAELLEVMRAHRPRLRLPRSTAAALRTLRAHWRTGIVTNGIPAMQARKVDALGVGELVDTVVFAHEHGTCRGKPEAAAFVAALSRLGVRPDRAIFVGNDEECDIAGAAAVGMRTVLLVRGRDWIDSESESVGISSLSPTGAERALMNAPMVQTLSTTRADVVVRSMAHVPAAVAGMLS